MMMCMKRFNRISDEELAAYLEEMLAEDGNAMINADIDTLEVLSVSRKAVKEMPAENIVQLPSWNNVTPAGYRGSYEPLAMAGFLGDCCANEDDEECDEQ